MVLGVQITKVTVSLARRTSSDYCLRNSDLRQHLSGYSSGKVSRLLKRLRIHGLIKRIGKTYKYYLTALGRRVVLAGFTLKQYLLLPGLTADGQQLTAHRL